MLIIKKKTIPYAFNELDNQSIIQLVVKAENVFDLWGTGRK